MVQLTEKHLPSDLSRNLQSQLHDMADKVGENVAMGTIVEANQRGQECSCRRYSERASGKVFFWYDPDPECEYVHLQPLPMAHVINLP